MAAQTCPRCGVGQMDYTGNPVGSGLFEHRCLNCGYVDHYREIHTVPDEQPATGKTQQLTELTAEVLSTEGDEDTRISIGGACVSIPPAALPPGATVTVTVTYTLTISPPAEGGK